MNIRPSTAQVTHTSVSGDLESLHREFEEKLRELETRIGGRVPNRIGGRDDADGEFYTVSSPADSRVRLGEFVEASPKAVARAIDAARTAFPSWSAVSW